MKNNDLTQGKITPQLIAFALPLLVGALIQQLYSTVDMMFVGRVLGTEAAAAVGSSGMIVNCIVGFFTGLSVGVGVVAGKCIGSRDENRLHRILHSAAALTIVMGLGFTAAGYLLAPTILGWMDTPEDIMPQAVTYIRIYLLSLFSIVSYNVGTGVLKALGDSKTPTLYQMLGGIANVAGNYLFIVILRWGVVGAALTTLLSQTLAAGLTVSRLFRLPEGYRLRIREIRLEGRTCLEILSVGIPSAVQAIMISLSNAIIQTHINRMDVLSIASFTAYYKVENFIYYPIMAVGQACSAFISQNVGAGKLERARKGTAAAIRLGVIVTLTTSGLVLLLRPWAFGLFTKDPEVLAMGGQIAMTAYPFYFLYVFLEVYADSIRGAGKAMPTMVITIVNMCLFRVVVLKTLLHFIPTAVGAAAVYPITWVSTSLSMYLYYRSNRWIPKGIEE